MSKQDRRIWAICLAAVAALAAVLVVGSMAGDDASEQVKVACREWVAEEIRDPGADFANEQVASEGHRYVVTGVATGASFTCVAEHDGNAARLVDLSVR